MKDYKAMGFDEIESAWDNANPGCDGMEKILSVFDARISAAEDTMEIMERLHPVYGQSVIECERCIRDELVKARILLTRGAISKKDQIRKAAALKKIFDTAAREFARYLDL